MNAVKLHKQPREPEEKVIAQTIIALSLAYAKPTRLSLMGSKLLKIPNDFGNGSMLLILRKLLQCKEANTFPHFQSTSSCNEDLFLCRTHI